MQEIDIKWKNPYPANVLSNYYANAFVFDDVPCASMEGFLQALKYRNAQKQLQVCLLTDNAAKDAGKKRRWWKLTGNLYWKGKRYKRGSREFDELRARAYDALLENKTFSEALASTKGITLVHSYGAHKKRKTILTEEEFIGYLEGLRNRL